MEHLENAFIGFLDVFSLTHVCMLKSFKAKYFHNEFIGISKVFFHNYVLIEISHGTLSFQGDVAVLRRKSVVAGLLIDGVKGVLVVWVTVTTIAEAGETGRCIWGKITTTLVDGLRGMVSVVGWVAVDRREVLVVEVAVDDGVMESLNYCN